MSKDERAHCEAVISKFLENCGDGIRDWAGLLQRERAAARAEALAQAAEVQPLLKVARAAEEVVRLNEADRDIDAFWGAVGALGRALEAK